MSIGVATSSSSGLAPINRIPAHNSRVALLSFSRNGSLLATASQKGTVIRVFSTPDGGLVAALRRGSRPAELYSMAFNSSGTLLGVTSSRGTAHIFDSTPRTPAQGLKMMPKRVKDVLEPRRAKAYAKLPAGISNVLAFSVQDELLVLSRTGVIARYGVPDQCRSPCGHSCSSLDGRTAA